MSALSVSRLRHDAFVYHSADELAGRMVPFLEAGLAEGEAAVAVTTRSNWALLRDALGRAANDVLFAERGSWYLRPAGAIAGFDGLLRRLLSDGAPSARVVAEVSFGPTSPEWDDWTAFEAICNRALAHQPAWLVCLYDAGALPERVVGDAWRTHARVLDRGWHASACFAQPEEVVRELARAEAPLPQLTPLTPGDDPGAFREQLARRMAAAGVPDGTAQDMLLAVSEVVSNAWLHGGGPGMLRAGSVDGRFVCEVSDCGGGFDDPLAGYIPPAPDGAGAGLWIARQLTRRLDLLPSPNGLTVRLWL